MQTETASDRYADLDTWSADDILAALVDSNRSAVESIAAARPALARAAEGIAGRLASGGRLVYIGAGTSGRLALLDAAELPPTFGFDRAVVLMAGGETAHAQATEGAEDDAEAAVRAVDREDVGSADAVVGLAASGRTPYTVAGLERARERGAFSVGIANNPDTPLLRAAEVAVWLDSGPEVLAGSTRLAAGTAQKIALNALSTAVLVRLGGAYGNLMVGMRPTNIKLRGRATGIVVQATDRSEEEARTALEAAAWDIRTAILMLRGGVSAERARELLETHDYRVRDALSELS